MTIEELQNKLDTLLRNLPASGFDSVSDNAIEELEDFSSQADALGMQSCKKLILNLQETLKTRKTGGNTDESVQLRLTALDFYIKNLKSDSTEDI
jgi:hypothetical protein